MEKINNGVMSTEEYPYPIPSNWRWMKLASVYKINPRNIAEDDLMAAFVPMEKIRPGMDDAFSFEVQPWSKAKKGHTQFADGDVAFAKISPCFENRKSMTVHDLPNGIGGGTTELVILRQPLMHQKYTYWYINTEQFISGGCATYSGTVGQQRISMDFVRNYPIPVPPFVEQQRIVNRIEELFAKLDDAKEKAQEIIDGYESRKTAILHQAFLGKLTAKWRSEHKKTEEEWLNVTLAQVCKINPPKADTRTLPDDLDVSFFPMPSLSELSGEITDPQVRKLKEVRTGFTSFIEGDVVFAKITPCMENGKSAVIGKLVNDIGFGTTEFFVLRCSDKIDNRFLWHMIRDRSFRNKAKAVMAGAVGQQRVPKSFLEEYHLRLPLIDEQKEIVRLLDDAIKKEQIITQNAEYVINQIDYMKKSILAHAFHGELGTNDPTEPPTSLS